jgi:hypothetical protein
MKAAPHSPRSLNFTDNFPEADRFRVNEQHYLMEELLQDTATNDISIVSSHSHAASLMPLRDRDLKTLSDLFASEDIEAIEADILCNLTRMLPEPCWEDNPFDFLQDYL